MSVFDNLIGKRINRILISESQTYLAFRTIDGETLFYATSGDCCNSVWVNHIAGVNILGKGNSFDLLRGALVTGAEDKGWGDNRSDEEGYDVIQDGFWTIRTDRGYIDIEVRNSHNGYYGGNFEPVEARYLDQDELRPVVEDF